MKILVSAKESCVDAVSELYRTRKKLFETRDIRIPGLFWMELEVRVQVCMKESGESLRTRTSIYVDADDFCAKNVQ